MFPLSQRWWRVRGNFQSTAFAVKHRAEGFSPASSSKSWRQIQTGLSRAGEAVLAFFGPQLFSFCPSCHSLWELCWLPQVSAIASVRNRRACPACSMSRIKQSPCLISGNS